MSPHLQNDDRSTRTRRPKEDTTAGVNRAYLELLHWVGKLSLGAPDGSV